MGLEEYSAKRDFQRTPEPSPAPPTGRSGPLRFTIQQHAARRLHYDVRLEVDGVLKSWPVPKGPSRNPAERRLAVMTEDHPLSYGTFEGHIPAGQYGAGQVIVWDAGTYAPLDPQGRPLFRDRDAAETLVREGIASGKLSFYLNGRKLKGVWTFARTKQNWLMLKRNDAFADPAWTVTSNEHSVLSNLTLADLRAGVTLPPNPPLDLAPTADGLPGATPGSFPSGLRPMLPALEGPPLSDSRWLYEPKLDGYRVLAFVQGGVTRLVSRGGQDVSKQFPEIVADLALQPVQSAVFDGELLAIDSGGRPSFQSLQNRAQTPRGAANASRLAFHAFDLLYLDGMDVCPVPLEQRKLLLRAVLAPLASVQYLDHFSDGAGLFRAAQEHHLEGIVAKRRASTYQAGKRSNDWGKIKTHLADEFVIGGYTAGQGNRAGGFGSLLLGEPAADGSLEFVGHVGTGFSTALLADLLARLQAIRTDRMPFRMPPPTTGRWKPAADTQVTWVRPSLVAEVKYAERTEDGILRHPVFLRLREDKPVSASVSERPLDPPARQPNAELLASLNQPGDSLRLEIDGRSVPLTNLNKVMWPAHGNSPALTKRDLVAYYVQIAPYVLPHLKNRPITLIRYPGGVTEPKFYQKNAKNVPEFVETVRLFSAHNDADVEHLLCNNLATLVWLAQVADLELHVTHTRAISDTGTAAQADGFVGSLEAIKDSVLNHPDFIVVDLDPYLYSGNEAPGAEPELNQPAFARTCEVARIFKKTLDQLGLPCFLKTSGRTGLHIFVPIVRTMRYAAVHAVAETLSRHVERAVPGLATTEWSVGKRGGRVFLDYNMNARGKTLAAVYSPRATPWAGVSVPLGWDELDRIYPSDFTILTAPDRLARIGDLWQHILDAPADLSGLLDPREIAA